MPVQEQLWQPSTDEGEDTEMAGLPHCWTTSSKNDVVQCRPTAMALGKVRALLQHGYTPRAQHSSASILQKDAPARWGGA